MPEKSVREMSAFERQHYSLAGRVWRSIVMATSILALVSVLYGLGAYAYALVLQHLEVAYNYAGSVAEALAADTDVEGLSEDFMATYRSLSSEQREQSGTLSYQNLFVREDNAPVYYRVRKLLEAYEGNADIKYIYIAMIDHASSTLVTLVDPDPDIAYATGTWTDVSRSDIERFESESFDEDPVFFITLSDVYGPIGTSGYPIRDAGGETVAYVMADVSIESILPKLKSYFIGFGIVMFLLINGVSTLITMRLQKDLVAPINQIAEAAEGYIADRAAGSGDADHFSKLDISTGDEIENLALIMADMEKGLADYEDNLTRVTAEKQRISTELNLATAIQASMLPNIFPPFPERTEFDIYAIMDPAKEVGGDFYDFFMVDSTHLAMVIADVSGKGIPAALYMMMTKILINDYAVQGNTPADVFTAVNRVICSNNATGMFITAWMGILDVETGTVIASNAGHEYPSVRLGEKPFELLKDRHGFVLGGMEESRYRNYEFTLAPGDSIFVYTDGAPEATNAEHELFGTDRLLEALNTTPGGSADDTVDDVIIGIEHFVGDAEQFDDLTLLCLCYRGPQQDDLEETNMDELTIEATIANIPIVTDYVNEQLEAVGCPIKAQTQIDIAIDELFSNIARYAYSPETGPATVVVDVDEENLTVTITFIDNGVPFDPLAADDPDVTLSAEERSIGGLGIFLVKQTMDDVSYEYRDGSNILRIKKSIEPAQKR